MTSVIYFKLKNAIQQQHVNFDGSVIQIGDVKNLIAQKQGLGPDGALELTLTDPNTGDEYDDDGKVIPRNTLVLVKRTPAARFKPLVAIDASTAPATQPAAAATAEPLDAAGDGPAAGGMNEFGGDFYSEKPTAAVVNDDENKAMQSFLQGTASTWQREVRQGVMRGRGRGRGGRGNNSVSLDYKCPRCDAIGVHWLQDCPTQGDPAYDRKRIRPPVGIPMTRLARSQEGGLVLPDGQTGTLVANEDAFAREILGFGLMSNTQEPASQQQHPSETQQQQQEAVLALDNKPANTNLASNVLGAGQSQPQPPPPPMSMQPASFPAPALGPAPTLAGEDDGFAGTAAAAEMPGAHIFDVYMRAALLPRGPPQFLEKAFGGAHPLSRSEFERSQDEYRRRYNLPPIKRRRRSRTRSRSRSPSRRRRDRERGSSRRSKSRSRSRTRDRSRDRDRDRSKRSSSRRDKERERSSERGSRREKERSSREKEREDRSKKDRSREKDKERKPRSGDGRSSSRSEKEKKKERTPSVPPLSEIPEDAAAAVAAAGGDAGGHNEAANAAPLTAATEPSKAKISPSPSPHQDVSHEPELDYYSSDPEEEDEDQPAAAETKTGKTTKDDRDDDDDKDGTNNNKSRKPIVWPGGGSSDARRDRKESSDRHRGGDDRKKEGDKSSSRRDRERDSRERPSSRRDRDSERDRDRSSRRDKERESRERGRDRDSKEKEKERSKRGRGSSRDRDRKRARSSERKEKDSTAAPAGKSKRERHAS